MRSLVRAQASTLPVRPELLGVLCSCVDCDAAGLGGVRGLRARADCRGPLLRALRCLLGVCCVPARAVLASSRMVLPVLLLLLAVRGRARGVSVPVESASRCRRGPCLTLLELVRVESEPVPFYLRTGQP